MRGKINMDKFDLQILDILQKNGKISIAELGRLIGLSTTATKERVKKLEAEGVITGYVALVDGQKVGREVSAFITVPVGEMTIKDMGDRLSAIPEVVECHKVTGNTCFLIKIIAKSPGHLERLVDAINHYAKNTYTYLVLSTQKQTTYIDLNE